MADGPKLPVPNPERDLGEGSEAPGSDEIVAVLNGYKQEAEAARNGGPNNRDEKWSENLDLYWNRWDFSHKAKWQAREKMPEVPMFVDRFAAALKEALVSVPEGFYTVVDPADKENDLTAGIKRMTDVWLSTCGRNQNGQILPFSSVFEEQVKLGAIMASSGVVTWKNDTKHGRVAVETVDPRMVWIDHTYRNLYRIRRVELDKHDLRAMANEKDNKGNPIWNLSEIDQLVTSMIAEDVARREDLTGQGQEIVSTRQPVVLEEYLATVVGPDGKVWADDELMVVANGQFLIRGPEKNPFWHGKDWMVFAPFVTTPLSVYGRSYMEDFGAVAKTFNELTNLILDATFTSSMRAFAMSPGMLLNPEQAAEGISPNKVFLLEDGVRPQDFFKDIELGNLPPEAVQVWNTLKNELTEAAGINEVGLGQFAPNSRTSATEIVSAEQNSNALVRSVAQTVEARFLDPCLDLVWKTGLQHAAKDDPVIRSAVGDEMFQMFRARRKEWIERPITFQARGISTMIQKGQMLDTLVQMLQLMAGSEMLVREFLRVVDVGKLVELMLDLAGIDVTKLQRTERERMMRGMTEQFEQRRESAEAATAGQEANTAATAEMAALAQALGAAGQGAPQGG